MRTDLQHCAAGIVLASTLALAVPAWASKRCPRAHRRCAKTITAIHVLSSVSYDQPGNGWSDSVSAEVSYDHGSRTLEGVKLTFAIVSDATGKTLATFPGLSNVFDSCDLVASLDVAGTETLVGQSVLPGDSACRLSVIEFPAHSASLRVTFAGNTRYARSVGTGSLG